MRDVVCNVIRNRLWDRMERLRIIDKVYRRVQEKKN